METVRAWLLGLLALGIWILSVYGSGRPTPLPFNAPVQEFSAVRADAVLARLLGPERPHPNGSPEAGAFRSRLEAELKGMNATYEEHTAQSCYGGRNWHACGVITNIIAEVVPGTGKHVLLVAHTDSVTRGPGAADDASGVAIILETVRALKAQPLTNNRPIVVLFSDGEEKGLLGAAAYAADPANITRTGVVVNVEARGNQGPSLLFQTSPGDMGLIDLYARAAQHPATSSLYGEIYKLLPNDTDLTPFLAAGIAGVNFAFIGNVRQYHTAQDRRANIDLHTLQHQGENVLVMTKALAHVYPTSLKGANAIYLDILARWLPRLPAVWGPPLALVCFVGIALAGWLTPRERRVPKPPILTALAPALLLFLCVVAGFVLHTLAAWIGASPNPSLMHPVWLRWALCFGVWAATLLTARWAGGIACWLWFSGLAVLSAIWLPGLSPYFLFPSLIAAPLLLLSVRAGRKSAFLLSALVALLIWLGLNAGSEAIMGLSLHPIFTVTAAFAALALLPLMAGQRLGGSALASSVVAIALAATAGLNVS
jgi:hypothetical protein